MTRKSISKPYLQNFKSVIRNNWIFQPVVEPAELFIIKVFSDI